MSDSALTFVFERLTPTHGIALALLLVVACGAYERLQTRAQRPFLRHDESTSYLAATCHETEFGHALAGSTEAYAALRGQWLPAQSWKRFVTPERGSCFGTISRDLAHADVHPPLYFWLLHVWVRAVGIDLWTGPVLNLLLFILGALGLFALARRLLGDPFAALVVVSIWSFCPVIAEVAHEARPYELFALTTIYFMWAVAIASDREHTPGPFAYLGLALATAAGILTHYHFVLVIGACALWGLIRLRKSRLSRYAFAIAAVLGGIALACALHPLVNVFFGLGRARVSYASYAPESVRSKLAFAWSTLGAGFGPLRAWLDAPYLYALLALCVLLVVAFAYPPARARVFAFGTPSALRGASVLVVASVLALAISVAYAIGVTPTHAMRPKYVAEFWPAFAFVPVVLARALPRLQPLLLGLVALSYAAAAYAFTPIALDARARLKLTHLDADHVTIGDGNRLRLPRYLLQVPDDAQIYFGPPASVAANFEAWRDDWRRCAYVTNKGAARGAEMRQLIELARSRGLRVRQQRHGEAFVTSFELGKHRRARDSGDEAGSEAVERAR